MSNVGNEISPHCEYQVALRSGYLTSRTEASCSIFFGRNPSTDTKAR